MRTSAAMRRLGAEKRFLKQLAWVAFLVFYQSLTTVFAYLPPLIGIFFTYTIMLTLQKQKTLKEFGKEWYFCLFYLTFAEQAHGFALFSAVIAFMLFYHFMSDWLIVTLKSRELLAAGFVASGYVWTCTTSSFISYAANLPMLKFGYEYLIYVGVESVLAVVLFRGRL